MTPKNHPDAFIPSLLSILKLDTVYPDIFSLIVISIRKFWEFSFLTHAQVETPKYKAAHGRRELGAERD
jgi:hypothetical protein